MIKKLSVFVALMALAFTDLALAASAAVTSVTGTAQVQTGTSSPRTLRQGDEVSQGDTVVTGANSSIVLKFDDGQVAALTANSRMVISAYTYNPANESGNVLLSLVSGGMRAITGLIGRRAPSQVAYRAATATIGIRGTDAVIATDGTNVLVTVTDGSVSYTFGGETFTIGAGEAVYLRPGQPPIRGPIATVVPQTPQPFQNAVSTASTGVLNVQVGASGPGQPRQGGDQTGGPQSGTNTAGNAGQPAGGGAGGGQASGR